MKPFHYLKLLLKGFLFLFPKVHRYLLSAPLYPPRVLLHPVDLFLATIKYNLLLWQCRKGLFVVSRQPYLYHHDLPHRSEEHTSELQSRPQLVCRLLLEKKKNYAVRNMVDRLSVLSGVAQVRIGGERRYAMRLWLDRQTLAARQVTVADV